MRLTDLRKAIQNSRVELVTQKNSINEKIATTPRDVRYSDKYYAEKNAKLYEPYYKAVATAKEKFSTKLADAERVASDNIRAFYMTPPTKEQRDLIEVMRERSRNIEPNRFDTYIPSSEMRMFYDAIKDNYLAQTLAEGIFKANQRTADDVLILPPGADEVSNALTKETRLIQDAINNLDAEPKNMTYAVADFYLSGDDCGINSVYMRMVDALSSEEEPSYKEEPTTADSAAAADDEPDAEPISLGALINEAITECTAHNEPFKLAKLKLFRAKCTDALLKDASECKPLLEQLASITDSGY